MKGLKFRFSKKLLIITMGSIVVLGGGSGAAAVFIGTDKFLGPSYLEINGLKCRTLDTVKIKKDQRLWVRKYVTTDETGDGVARIKTAMRVAGAVQEKEKADVVLVAMLDKTGPTERAEMRGRKIGAQVIYIPDLAKAPQGLNVQTYSAYYLDGAAASGGEFYGLRIDLPLEDAESLKASLTDHADCVDPAPAAAPAGAHGAAPAAGHGEKPKGGGHGDASGHGAPAKDAHGAAPAGHGKEAPAEGHGEGGETAAKESEGFFASLTGKVTGLIFGSKAEAPAEGHDEAGAHGEGQAAPVTDDHATSAPAGHGAGKPAAADGHGTAKPLPADSHASQPAAPKQAASAEHKTAEPKKDEGGFLASLTGMIFGGGEAEKPAEPKTEASASPAKPAGEAPPPRTSAEGGKRWSSQTAADAAQSGNTPAPHVEAAPPPTDGNTAADAAGAAWLAKMRGEAAAPKP